jgi:murein DD-endopeptidase MepM/ murein hydrolase activator NlpD
VRCNKLGQPRPARPTLSWRELALVVLVLASCVQGGPSRFGPRMNCAWRVCLTHVDTPSGRAYRVENREPVPVTVGLDFRQLDNLREPQENPVRWVIPAQASEEITVATVRQGQAVSADVAMSVDLGASSTEADDFVYAVPFGGTSPRPLIQGYGGAETHIASMRYSLDFGMPEGTPVLAARPGVVLYVQDGFREGGADPSLLERANLVVVAHADGTMASYGHLRRGLEVSVGEEVVEGQLLGHSGRTGFAGQPHLHFHVGLRMLGEPGRTIPIRMRDEAGQALELSTGRMIPAAPQAG